MKKLKYFYIPFLFLLLGITQIQAQSNVVPICITEANVVLSDGEATIWAKDFDRGSFAHDNSEIRYTFTDTKPTLDPNFDQAKKSSFKTISTTPNTTKPISLYVWDSNDNFDYCVVSVTFIEPGSDGAIIGNIRSIGTNASLLKNVEISLTNINNYEEQKTITNSFGSYSFSSIESGTYKVTPIDSSSFRNVLDGVSTLDIVMMQKHILQIKSFSKAFQFIAGDVNNDKYIDILDVVQVRDIILGERLDFPIKVSKKYFVAGQLLSPVQNILNKHLKEYAIAPINNNTASIDFEAVKLGDVNNSVNNSANNFKSMEEWGITEDDLLIEAKTNNNKQVVNDRNANNTVIFTIPDVIATPNDEICIPVTVQNFNNLAGFQFALSWDESLLKFKNTNLLHSQPKNKKGELLLLFEDRVNSPIDNNVFFELCFDVIGEEGEYTPLSFENTSDFRSVVCDHDKVLPFELQAGSVTIGKGCLKNFTVSLGPNSEATVLATDLYVGEEPSDILKVNGEDHITFTCDDLDSNSVEITISHDGTTDVCFVNVFVKDKIPPTAICEEAIQVTYGLNKEFQFNANRFDNGSYDNCSDVHFLAAKGGINDSIKDFKQTLSFDCDDYGESYVTLKSIDQSGNYSLCYTEMFIKDSPYNGTMACNSIVLINVNPYPAIEVNPNMLLEGFYTVCDNYFDLSIYDTQSSTNPQPDNIIEFSDVGNTYYVKIEDPNSNNYCWSQITIIHKPQNNTVHFILPDVTAEKNDDICVSIRVENFTKIEAFQIPVSWNKDILTFNKVSVPQDSPMKIGNFSYYQNDDQLKALFYYTGSISIPDNGVLFDVCFTVIGDNGSYSDLLFQSKNNTLEPEVVSEQNTNRDIKLTSGSVAIEKSTGCTKNIVVALDATGNATIPSDRFYNDLSDVDYIKVNGEDFFNVSCEDLGFEDVQSKVYHKNGEVEDCSTRVYVRDLIPPFIKANNEVTITLPHYDSTHSLIFDQLVEDLVDNCSVAETKISHSIIDCNSSNPLYVKLTATDQSGNSSFATTKITINYTDNSNTTLVCNDEVKITIANNNSVEVTPDMLLEGNNYCYGSYKVRLFDFDTGIQQADNILDNSDINKKYKYSVKNTKTFGACYGQINVTGTDCDLEFKEEDIAWPCDINVTSCYNINNSLTPEVLLSLDVDPECTQPTLNTNDCQVVTSSYADNVFLINNKYKIIREWTVTDWYVYVPNTNDNGKYSHLQIIYVTIDSTDREFTICDTLPWSAPFGNCESGHTNSDGIEWPEKEITLEWRCSDFKPSLITPAIIEELGNFDYRNAKPQIINNSCHLVGMSYNDQLTYNNDYPELTRNWTITDWKTNNKYYWKQVFKILTKQIICDTKAWDTPVGDCESGHTLDDLLEWPADIVVTNTNTSPTGLKYNPEVHENNIKPRIINSCGEDYVEVFYSDTISIQNDSLMYIDRYWTVVNDFNGSVGFYNQKIVVKAKLDDITAYAFREDGSPIADVKMLNGYKTSNDGSVLINNIIENTVIKPSKEGNWKDGINMSDEILMYKYLLGLSTLSPYQKIAADINTDGKINTIDAVLLQKIIYRDDYAPTTTPWVFVDAKYSFLYNKPLQSYPNSIVYTSSQKNYNFVGIKVGDIDNSYNLGSSIGQDSTGLKIKDEILNKGELYSVNLHTTKDYSLDGVQFTLNFDDSKVKINSISCELLPKFSMKDHVKIENGKLVLKYKAPFDDILKGGVSIAPEALLFNIELEAIENGILNECLELNENKANLIVAKKTYKLGLEWQEKIVNNIDFASGEEIKLYPQPANNFVIVNTKNQNITYTISNIVGQKVMNNKLNGNKIDISNLKNGLYLIQFYSEGTKISVNKLIVNHS